MTPTVNKNISVSYHKKKIRPCPHCKTKELVIYWGFHPNKLQRYLCKKCKRTFNKKTKTAFAGLRTPRNQIITSIQALVENQGHRNAARSHNFQRRELINWLQRAALQCQQVTQKTMRVIPKTFLEFDKLYTYVHCKSFRHYLWTCVDAISKLWLGFHVSFVRNLQECKNFFHTFLNRISEVAGATSDGLSEYAALMEKYFPKVPFAQIVKRYEGKKLVEVLKKQCGKHTVSSVEFVIASLKLGSELNTSAVERFNATLRAFLPCLNRKTLKFVKHVGNFEALLHVFQVYYNFCLKHQELQATPAQAAGLTTRRLTLRDVLTMER